MLLLACFRFDQIGRTLKLCFAALSGQKVNLLENPEGVTVSASRRGLEIVLASSPW
jgi:hypothetical protein